MDLNCFFISLTLVALQFQFVYIKDKAQEYHCSRSRKAYILSLYVIITSLDFFQILNVYLWFYIQNLTKDNIEYYYFSSKMDDIQFDQNIAIEDMWQIQQLLEQENNNKCQAFEQLQVGALPESQNLEGIVNQ
jgi:hypothetical protein